MISSAVHELPQHREAAVSACEQSGFQAIILDVDDPALSGDFERISTRSLEAADVYLGIFGHRYGFVPPGFDVSITELEYNEAVRLAKPRLVFLIDSEHPATPGEIETGPNADKLQAFKQRVERDGVLATFRSPEELRAKIVGALGVLGPQLDKREAGAAGAQPPDGSADPFGSRDGSAAGPAPPEGVDAFILFNEREGAVATVVGELERLGISTHFWRRDVAVAQRLDVEQTRLAAARTVVLFLGASGWGPTHLALAEQAQKLGKAIIPVAISPPPADALDALGGLFRDYRYFDLARQSVAELADEIRKRIPGWTSKRPIPPPPVVTPDTPADVATIMFARMGNDNPERPGLDDMLGAGDEAKAFARVAAARQVDPPLAFGIFGNWGSGKSFFMRLMHEHVEKLANKTVAEAKTDLFHQNVVQIRFNAWHYVETNLWASLVDYIFSELDRWIQSRRDHPIANPVFDKLATARDLTLVSAEQLVMRRKEQKVAAERLATAERQLTAAQEKIGATPRLFWEVVRDEFHEVVPKQDLEKAAATLGLDQLADNAELLKHEFDALKQEGRRAQLVASGMRARLLAAPSLIAILIAIVLVPPLLLWLREWFLGADRGWPLLKGLVQHVNEVVLGAAGLIASGAAIVAAVAKQVRGAVGKFEGYRDKMNDVISKQIRKPREDVKSAQQDLAKLSADVAEARAFLATTSDRLAEAAREYASGSGKGRLLQFVRERARQGQYAKHLGLIATVRKDFTELSAMLSKPDKNLKAESERQREAYKKRVELLISAADEDKLLTDDDKATLLRSAELPDQTTTPTFERIILYIDDLDRCPPRKVVDVLQAVHLLLTFPLFVAVVAVDVRWVSRCLERHYVNLLGRDRRDVANPGATARDYLEKIFQVPYWVRAMTDQGSRDLLFSLAAPPAAESTQSSGEGGGSQSSAPDPGTPAALALAPQVAAAAAPASPDPANPPPQPQPAQSTAAGPTAQTAARALELTDAEQAFMHALAPSVGDTPRRVLRFLNTYRVVKASLSASELHKLEKGGGYRGLMTQLAVATASPELQMSWSSFLESVGQDATTGQMTDGLKQQKWLSASAERVHLERAVAAFRSSAQSMETGDKRVLHETSITVENVRNRTEDLRQYVSLARRYTFGA